MEPEARNHLNNNTGNMAREIDEERAVLCGSATSSWTLLTRSGQAVGALTSLDLASARQRHAARTLKNVPW
jgi:hypothetical protein